MRVWQSYNSNYRHSNKLTSKNIKLKPELARFILQIFIFKESNVICDSVYHITRGRRYFKKRENSQNKRPLPKNINRKSGKKRVLNQAKVRVKNQSQGH